MLDELALVGSWYVGLALNCVYIGRKCGQVFEKTNEISDKTENMPFAVGNWSEVSVLRASKRA